MFKNGSLALRRIEQIQGNVNVILNTARGFLLDRTPRLFYKKSIAVSIIPCEADAEGRAASPRGWATITKGTNNMNDEFDYKFELLKQEVETLQK